MRPTQRSPTRRASKRLTRLPLRGQSESASCCRVAVEGCTCPGRFSCRMNAITLLKLTTTEPRLTTGIRCTAYRVACTPWFVILLLIPVLLSRKGARPLDGWLTGEEIFDTDVLVQFRPVNAVSVSNQLPFRAMLGASVRQPGI